MSSININDILNTKVSVYKDSVHSKYVYYNTTILDFLTNVSMRYKDNILELREINKKDEKLAKKMKLTGFQACTISGIFDKHRKVGCIKEKTGLIAIDIDKDKNPNIDVDKAKLDAMRLPYVALCSLSIRGNGVWCLIPYNKDYYIGYVYNALKEDFKKIGYVTDDNCSDITRLRIVSIDNHILKRDIVEVYDKQMIKEKTEYHCEGEWELTKQDIRDIVIIVYVLTHFHNYTTDDYNDWLYEGFRLATIPNYEVGLKLFQMISENSDNYKGMEDVENKFEECRNTTVNTTNVLGYYINKIKEIYGVDWRYRVSDLLKKHNILFQ